jgi:hypothetical protein
MSISPPKLVLTIALYHKFFIMSRNKSGYTTILPKQIKSMEFMQKKSD